MDFNIPKEKRMSQSMSHAAACSTPIVSHAKDFAWPSRASRGLTSVLVVEHRDEVFARIEADLAAWGVKVQRALSAAEARRRYDQWPMELVLIHADLPDETGWLFACKLRLAQPGARLWVYTPWWTSREPALAEFIGVEETIAYGGDLQRLAAEILDRLVVSSFPFPPSTATNGCDDCFWIDPVDRPGADVMGLDGMW
jgi:CheY-like chemotaxis protein